MHEWTTIYQSSDVIFSPFFILRLMEIRNKQQKKTKGNIMMVMILFQFLICFRCCGFFILHWAWHLLANFVVVTFLRLTTDFLLFKLVVWHQGKPACKSATESQTYNSLASLAYVGFFFCCSVVYQRQFSTGWTMFWRWWGGRWYSRRQRCAWVSKSVYMSEYGNL